MRDGEHRVSNDKRKFQKGVRKTKEQNSMKDMGYIL